MIFVMFSQQGLSYILQNLVMCNFVENIYIKKMNSKEGIAALFHFAVDGILVVNERGEIIHINPSAEKLFGYGEHELSGKKIETLVPKRLAGRHEEHRAKYNPNPHAR